MKIQSVSVVAENELLRALDGGDDIAEIASDAEVNNVSFGDACYTLVDVPRYKADVLSAYDHNLDVVQRTAVNALLDSLPPGTYIDLECKVSS